MVYVFGEIQSPAEESVHLIEDMVRSQMIELATRARTISYLRNARYLTIEDVIYLIRDDRARVNRLRTYLSWKEVRKTARKEESSATKGGADVEIEDLEDDLVEKKAPRKEVIKLPWEPLTPFAEVLKNLPGRQNGAAPDEEEDDDELEAYEDSLQRLREADSVTRRMSKEQYVFYSECRQASFTYRKAKRFRDFLNTTAYLDLKPNEDVMDVLGFLAFESVRSLCVAALEIRDAAAGAENMVSTPEAKMEQDSTSKTTPAKPRAKSPPPEPWKAPPTLPLLPAHLLTAYSRLQRGQATKKAGGLRNWRGGVKRTKIALI
ncbi:hypothetical protein FFLO_01511 [Filobasidium floriforme]|uniref:Uncharacterized protein n=1 Tax=Filobasidium floriforme TaxID=5210 RepID=A0A8K0JPW6_9TREE|nr:hypothetical protein FFLO_01511 [Filobasidium floriforme]